MQGIEIETNISQQPKTKLEKERFSYFYKDQVTGIYNKGYLEFVLAYNELDEFNLQKIAMIYLHNFNQYNKKHSWAEGDKLLKRFAQALDSIDGDFVFRVNGDDFIILTKEHFELSPHISKLEELFFDTDITLSYKYIDIKEKNLRSIEDLEKIL